MFYSGWNVLSLIVVGGENGSILAGGAVSHTTKAQGVDLHIDDDAEWR